MAVWSTVDLATALREQRLDPEFWQPTFLADQKATRDWPLLGKYLLGVQYGLSREMNDSGKGTPIYRMDEIEDLFLTVPEKFAEITSQEEKLLSLKKNDVLFNRTNSTRFVGRTGILKDDVQAIFASYLIRLSPDAEQLLPEYLTVYLNCPSGIRFVKRRAKESINQTNISGSEIRKVPLLVSSQNFQQRIAELVNQAAAERLKIARGYQLAEAALLDRLQWSKLSKQAFSQTYERQYKEVKQAGRFDAEFFQPHNERLRTHLLKENAGQIRDFCDTPVRGVQPTYVEKGPVAVVTSKHLGKIHVDDGNLDSTTREFYELADSGKGRLRENDVLLYATGAYVGRTNVWLNSGPALASNHVTIIRPDPSVCHPAYLALFLNSPVGIRQSEQYATGSAQRELYPSEVGKILVFLPQERGKPDLEWQMRLAEEVIAASEARKNVRNIVDRAKNLVEQEVQKHLR